MTLSPWEPQHCPSFRCSLGIHERGSQSVSGAEMLLSPARSCPPLPGAALTPRSLLPIGILTPQPLPLHPQPPVGPMGRGDQGMGSTASLPGDCALRRVLCPLGDCSDKPLPLMGQGWTWSWVITRSRLQHWGLGMGLGTSHGPLIVPDESQDYPEPANGAGEVNSLKGLTPAWRLGGSLGPHPTPPALPHVRGHVSTSGTHRASPPRSSPVHSRAGPPCSPSTGLCGQADGRGPSLGHKQGAGLS